MEIYKIVLQSIHILSILLASVLGFLCKESDESDINADIRLVRIINDDMDDILSIGYSPDGQHIVEVLFSS